MKKLNAVLDAVNSLNQIKYCDLTNNDRRSIIADQNTNVFI